MPIKAVLFDFMGTCLDWHSSIINLMPQSIDLRTRNLMALTWRHTYFKYNEQRRVNGLLPENIDTSHRIILEAVLDQYPEEKPAFTPEVVDRLIYAWHDQKAWEEVGHQVSELRNKGYGVFVHANGTTRLQLDLCISSGLQFDMLFSSQLLGVIKPNPEAYLKVLDLLNYTAPECVMVAAHVTDVRGAKAVGMKTIYIERPTDDVDIDKTGFDKEFDLVLNGMHGLVEAVQSLG